MFGKKKSGDGGGERAAGGFRSGGERGEPTKTHKSLIWLGWLLQTAGFGILLGGVASMQNECGSGAVTTLYPTGSPGYLAPVACDNLFQYTWWITFLHFFVWFLVLAYLVTGVIHKTRPALIGMLAVAAVLLMDTANTYIMFNYINGLSGKMATRTRVTTAGAIVAAVSDLFLILVVGWQDLWHHEPQGSYHESGYGANTTTTTTAAVPVTVPVTHTAAATADRTATAV